jgi:G3E family GTPase
LNEKPAPKEAGEPTLPDVTPIVIVSGFLGSGKTTFLRGLLRTEAFARAAVIINEFGDIGLDHELVEASSDDIQLLAGGCLCCTLRGNLIETLHDLYARRALGTVPPFRHVVVETSGLADPAGLCDALAQDDLVATRFAVAALVTLVDGVNGLATLHARDLSLRQAAAADALVITKSDIAAPDAIGALRIELAALNGRASVTLVTQGDVAEGSALFDSLLRPPPAGAPAGAAAAPSHAARDYADIDVAVFERAEPVEEGWVEACLAALDALKGPGLLRAKGIVAVEGAASPLVVQAVQDLVEPAMPIAPVHGHSHGSRFVLITSGIPAAEIDRHCSALGLGRR